MIKQLYLAFHPVMPNSARRTLYPVTTNLLLINEAKPLKHDCWPIP